MRQALLQCGNQIDNIAAGWLGPRGVAFLSLRLVFDQGTAVTQYMKSGGTIEIAQRIAGHTSPATTRIYDRSGDRLTIGAALFLMEG